MEPEPGRSAAPAAERGGWLSRIPLWVRILVPVLVLGGLAVALVVGLVDASESDDPEEVASAMCREAALEELDSPDRTAGDVSQDFEVIETDGGYRVQGTATYEDEDGATQSGLVRCVVAEEDGALRVRSVRFKF
ncbi:hypothetical protein ACFPER_09195 [Agromyces aurantiacus]|uniref:DUF4333 domain-containing protein n=1 Tax=Agromyces aurantiacus TaxID=165814 RepID=A0ABV9R6Q1_9MICO|nr:hypothetical protein [Agromyces aurantiacus]MBM7503647.1 hypothetical protein [Agromyces aurantiacus]